MYKAQFRSRRRCHNEDIHTYVEALQRLADMAWPFMDAQAKEELVVDQFLMGIESHELSVQVAAHGHRRMEDVLRVDLLKPCMRRSDMLLVHANQPHKLCFVTSGPPETTDTERVVQEVLAQLGQDSQRNQGGRRKKPTPGPNRVRLYGSQEYGMEGT